MGSIFEMTMAAPDMICLEYRDDPSTLGLLQQLSVPDVATGMINVTAAADNGSGWLRITTPSPSGLSGGLYITAMANNGSGLIRCTVYDTTGLVTGQTHHILHAKGTTEANKVWVITVINGTQFDLQGSVFTNVYLGCGVLIPLSGILGAPLTTMLHSLGGVPKATGSFFAARSSTTTFDLIDSDSSGAAYTSGGKAYAGFTWFQAFNPSLGGTDFYRLIGPFSQTRRFQDVRGFSFLNRSAAAVAANWSVTGRTVSAVYVYSMPYDYCHGRYTIQSQSRVPAVAFKHFIFIKLSANLPQATYTVANATAGLSTSFTFNDKVTRSLSIACDQVGHRPADPLKSGYLRLWIPGAPSHGAVDFSAYSLTGVGKAKLIDDAGNVVYSFDVVQRIAATTQELTDYLGGAAAWCLQRYADTIPLTVTGVDRGATTTIHYTVPTGQVDPVNGDRVTFFGMDRDGGGADGIFQLNYTGNPVPDRTFTFFGNVANSSALAAIVSPTLNDAWVTTDTDHLWIWNGTIWVDSVAHPSEYTVASVNTVAKTFVLSGINSTGYGAFLVKTPGNQCYQMYSANRAGTNVYELDYSGFTSPSGNGRYRVYVPGLGVSFPFYIHEAANAMMLRTYQKGLYHQRQGYAPDGRFGLTHPAPAKTSATRKTFKCNMPYPFTVYSGFVGPPNALTVAGDASEGQSFSPWITTTEETAYGAYKDAGDWDSRICSAFLGYFDIMDLFEHTNATSRSLANLDLGIPTLLQLGLDATIFAGTNSMPAPLVEVIATLEFYRQSQTGPGAISGGVNYGEGVGDWETSWNTNNIWTSYYPDHISGFCVAGMFAKLSRILSGLGFTALAATYKTAATNAWNWAEPVYQNTAGAGDTHYAIVKTIAGWDATAYANILAAANVASQAADIRNMAAAALYAMDPAGGAAFNTIANAAYVSVGDTNGTVGRGAWEYAKALGSGAVYTTIRSQLKSRALIRYVAYQESTTTAYHNGEYPGLNQGRFGNMGMDMVDFGWAVAVGHIICVQDGDTSNAPRCLKALHGNLTFRHGGNQNGMCMVSGLGSRNMTETLQLDARNSSQKLPAGYCSEAWAFKFGQAIGMFGVGFAQPVQAPYDPANDISTPLGADFQDKHEMSPVNRFCQPMWQFMPELHLAIEYAEFTTQQQLMPAYAVTLYLHGRDGNTQTVIPRPGNFKLKWTT